MLSKSISTSTKLSEVSDFAALLFTWLQPHCDDGGNMDANPLVVRGLVVPMRKQTVEDVAAALKELEKTNLVTPYEVNGTKYLHVEQFEKHQTLRGDRPDFRYPANQVATSGKPIGNQRSTGGKRNGTERNITEQNRTEHLGGTKKLENSMKYLDNVPKADIDDWTKRFVITEKQIKGIGEDLRLYCERKGRKYANYKSFLLNAIKRDFKERDGKAGKYQNL